MRVAELGEFIVSKTGIVKPSNFPDEQFEYYSIPAYDNGEPEVTPGSSIGSSKKNFQPGDVLLSRIVPHIRRCWIVPENHGYRQIGSGEWIVFRTKEIAPPFLRFYLMSDEFNVKFMKTIKGVGGSLMRADPNQVKKFKLTLPPLEEQKKIAAILDAADDYRQRTKALIDKYDQLTQSLFLDMFGDLKGDRVLLGSICEINPKKKSISNLDKSLMVSFVPMANVSEEGKLTLEYERTLESVWSGFTYFQENDVVFAKITPCMENGKGAIMRGLSNHIGFGTTEFHVLRPTPQKSNSEFLFYLTHSNNFRKLAELNMSGSAGQKRVPKDFLSNYNIVAPPIELQNLFAERVAQIEKQKQQAEASLVKAEELFNSLLQKAFKGELTN